MINLIFVFISALFMPQADTRPAYTGQDSLLFEKYIAAFDKKQDLPMGNLIAETALYFKGTPYVASTLEREGDERLVINLRQFDCTTFVETCIALSRTVKSEERSFKNFSRLLRELRYRGGIIDGYSSRLHYMSDWIYDNSQKGIISNITRELQGVVDTKEINFMTTHPDSYKQLKNSKATLLKMQKVEADINKRGGYYYIPKQNIPDISERIEDGDVILFATSIDGLDYSHVAIAHHTEDGLSFIDASTRTMAVTVESQLLYDYCMKSSKCTGVAVLRINK